MSRKTYSYHFQAPLSPTQYNVRYYLKKRTWIASDSATHADFSDLNFGFDEKASNYLEYKHLLADLVAQAHLDIMPKSFYIDDHNWRAVLATVLQNMQPCLWILKPSLLNNGQHIHIFRTHEQLIGHFSSPKRMGGAHVLQHYISNPRLLRDERKFSIRQFMVLTNFKGAWVYPEGYCNVALHPYKYNDFASLNCHLTNEHLSHHQTNVIQIPTSRFEFYTTLYPQIKNSLRLVVEALKARFPAAFIQHDKPTMALFGVDFMLDAQGKLWLLEANHGPCFPIDPNHSLQHYVYRDFWNGLIEDFIGPIVGEPTGFRFDKI